MKAIRFHQYGKSDVLTLEDIDKPVPRANEVLIEVKACGINYADIARRYGRYVVPTPLPFVPGVEIAGIVREVGEGVDEKWVGQPVITLLHKGGGYAEYAVAHTNGLIPIPSGLDYTQAVAIPLQGLTAYHVLKTSGQLQPGESVLVHAAAGGVGLLSVQLAKKFGAGLVIGTASTAEKRDLAKQAGADITIDYTLPDWPQEVLEATGGKGADVILEIAGGDMIQQNLKCLADYGRMVVFGAASGERGTLVPVQLMGKNQTVTGFFLGKLMEQPDRFLQSLKELLTWAATGQVKFLIGGVYPLAEAGLVQDLMEGRQTIGKLVLVP
ncbi:quinone oxidoreductase family protein [Effusibacillus lacus]|uniref:Alcohol dehydrogenase n=1 Tax=Effusibacillus lacus TaxID=1348429 RepID=A0A292YMP1_9BACL|nr:NADPH:quinone oxidoreductase family protein [Effusibacillus lacus]TCS76865.1 NADPH2:quinone reductase [Effusibacillus lacus]GAX91198.1 alcohol dehydrogenase [Effusibacillus lacus]